MSNETDSLERQAEDTRARIAGTADSLRAKMTPGQMIDDFTAAFRGGDGSVTLDNLKNQVRDNPLALALMGAGLGWLMLGNPRPSSDRRPRPAMEPPADSNSYGSGAAASAANDEGVLDKAKSAVSGTYHAGVGAVQAAADNLGEALSSTSRSAGDLGRSMYASGMSATGEAAHSLKGVPPMVSQMLEREPLITAALGVALGLALGSVLPHSNFEDEQLGPISDEVKEQAKDIVGDGFQHAKAVAGESFEALKQAADDEGLTPGDTPLAERVGSVIKSAVSAGEQAVAERLEAGEEISPDTPSRPAAG